MATVHWLQLANTCRNRPVWFANYQAFILPDKMSSLQSKHHQLVNCKTGHRQCCHENGHHLFTGWPRSGWQTPVSGVWWSQQGQHWTNYSWEIPTLLAWLCIELSYWQWQLLSLRLPIYTGHVTTMSSQPLIQDSDEKMDFWTILLNIYLGGKHFDGK